MFSHFNCSIAAKRILQIAAIIAMCCSPALGEPFQFSFAPPAGWKLDQAPPRKGAYFLRRTTAKEPWCMVYLISGQTTSLADAQAMNLSRVRAKFKGPAQPKISHTTLRSSAGAEILKAEVVFDTNIQPQPPSGAALHPLRYVSYSFRSPKENRVYSFECWPEVHNGTVFDRALDDLAKSVAF